MAYWIEEAGRVDEAQRTESLLRRLHAGDAAAADELLPLVYGELRGLAAGYMRDERAEHTLQTTALVNEAWLRLSAGLESGVETRSHFVAVAARAMRRVLIDHARRRDAVKRGGGVRREELDDALAVFQESAPDLLALDTALAKLERMDPQLGRVVELRFFGGASNQEVAEVLGVSLRTVERGWQTARAWLRSELSAEGGPE
jgi:RNA polymerase sigma factor (TIGR02999 family)